MFDFNLIMKGILIGLGKIIPGVSGSLIAVSLGLYDKAIQVISNPFKNIKFTLIFLGNIGLGILISIVVFSNFILFFLNNFFFVIITLFIGFIFGSFLSLLKDVELSNSKDYFIIVLTIILVLFLSFFRSENIYKYSCSFTDNVFVFICGFIDALTMIIPGISGTAIFLLMGCYTFVLNIFSSIYNIFDISTILFILGLLTGIVIVSKVMSYLLSKHRKNTYLCIIGFSIASIILLCLDIFVLKFSFVELIIGVCLFLLGVKISYKFSD